MFYVQKTQFLRTYILNFHLSPPYLPNKGLTALSSPSLLRVKLIFLSTNIVYSSVVWSNTNLDAAVKANF